jgi:hypothetical protein
VDQGVSEPTKPIAFDTLEAALAALAEREAARLARLKYGRFLAAVTPSSETSMPSLLQLGSPAEAPRA